MTRKYKKPGEKPLAVIDTETTGLNPRLAEIIQFAGQKYDRKGNLLEEMCLNIKLRHIEEPPEWAASASQGFLNPEGWRKEVQTALKMNSYSPELWKDAIPIGDALPQINEFLRGCILVGQNVTFDRQMLEAEFSRSKGGPFYVPYHIIDTVTLAYEHLAPLGLPSLSLSKPGGICDFLGIPIEGAHDALGDVKMTAQAFFMMDRANWWQRRQWARRWKKRNARVTPPS